MSDSTSPAPDPAAPSAEAPSAEAIARALAAHVRQEIPALPGQTNHLLSPVMLPLWRHEGRWMLWATRRTATLAQHAGEICFPGGKPEPEDAGDLERTARRELREELGLEVGPVLGPLSRIPLYTSNFRLVPFVAEVVGDNAPRLQDDEVSELLRLDLALELARPRIEAIPYQLGEVRGLAPTFAPLSRHGAPQPALMYGGTAMATYELLTVLAPLYGLPSAPPLTPGPHSWESAFRTVRPQPRDEERR